MLSKREEAAWPLLILNNNDPVFCTQLFLGPYFGLDIFQVPGPKIISGRPDKLKKWVQIDWTRMLRADCYIIVELIKKTTTVWMVTYLLKGKLQATWNLLDSPTYIPDNYYNPLSEIQYQGSMIQGSSPMCITDLFRNKYLAYI